MKNLVITIGQYGNSHDFFSLKGIIENLLSVLGITNISIQAESSIPYYHPGRCAKILTDGTELGAFGEVHPQVTENYGIDTRVYIARLSCSALFQSQCIEKQYHPLPKFPATTVIWRCCVMTICRCSLSKGQSAPALENS